MRPILRKEKGDDIRRRTKAKLVMADYDHTGILGLILLPTFMGTKKITYSIRLFDKI